MRELLLPVHIVAGGLAVILGAIALVASKGAFLHRKAGMLFVYAMLTMGASASILAMGNGQTANFIGGIMCAYFVITALTAVRPATSSMRWLLVGAAAFAFGLAAYEFRWGVVALGRPRMAINGVPAAMMFFLGTVALLAGSGDVRVLRSGPLRGAQRLRRHLWRMCFALFIAAGSFFSIRARVARVLPEPFLSPTMRVLPVLLIFVAMFYWLWRVRGRVAAGRLHVRESTA
jgi:hypothetical protein